MLPSMRRSRLSAQRFGQFLQAIKELNSGAKTRDQTLHQAKELFGTPEADLYGKHLQHRHGLLADGRTMLSCYDTLRLHLHALPSRPGLAMILISCAFIVRAEPSLPCWGSQDAMLYSSACPAAGCWTLRGLNRLFQSTNTHHPSGLYLQCP